MFISPKLSSIGQPISCLYRSRILVASGIPFKPFAGGICAVTLFISSHEHKQ